MDGTIAKLKKLRGRGADELRVRGAQALRAFAERRGLSRATREPSDARLLASLDPSRLPRAAAAPDALLEHFRARTGPRFFAAFDDPAATRAALAARFGGDGSREVIERARRVVAGEFDLLGYRRLGFGNPPDWHLEPVTRKRAPLAHWSEIDYLDAAVAGDKKITWELNRCQHFLTLGRAYWHTGDEAFAEAFAAHLSSWMDANPPKRGINWASSLEVAFRAISWLWSLHFFRDSPHLSPPLFTRALKFLQLHARHVETYLSTYFSPNTHLTGEALALLFIGTLLPEFRDAARWRTTGRRVLLEQLPRHVLTDGVYFERSTYYHRYTADFYTHFLLLERLNGGADQSRTTDGAGRAVEEKLSAMLDHLMHLARPDGTTPLSGDDDGGRLAPLDEGAADDFRPTLAAGAVVLARGDLKFVAGGAAESLLWTLGPRGLDAFDALDARPPSAGSRAFPEGGYYVMRDGWSDDANYLLVSSPPRGAAAAGSAHAHDDALSIDLSARGRALVVDPGTYTYTGDPVARVHFRSSLAHSAPAVDHAPASEPAGPFGWRRAARARLRSWLTHPRFDYFEAEHDGYARLPSPAAVSRALLFVKGGYWIARDRAETRAGARHSYSLRFQLAPRAAAAADASALRVAEGDEAGAGLDLFAFGAGGAWREEEAWVSRCYGSREPARAVVFEAEAAGPQEFYTFLVPRAAGRAGAEVRRLEATGGQLFEIARPGAETYDVLLAAAGTYAESGRFASDFEWSWARFTADGQTLEELVLVGGRRFSLYGREIVRLANRTSHVHARRDGDRLLVETPAGRKTVGLGELYKEAVSY